ncbi:hypothetical protein, partial [Herbaspirillum huttiense]|uniref:hypothetical protein n=1 Tax=Herbaspirillum huttiense TaxID=863372 RepID=UPI003B3B6071
GLQPVVDNAIGRQTAATNARCFQDMTALSMRSYGLIWTRREATTLEHVSGDQQTIHRHGMTRMMLPNGIKRICHLNDVAHIEATSEARNSQPLSAQG